MRPATPIAMWGVFGRPTFFRRCFEIRQKIFPKDSAPVIQGLYNLGRVLSNLGRNQEAEERFKSVLEMYLSIVA